MALAEQNYGAEGSKMFAVVEDCKYWKHYLKGATYSIWVVTDHMNLGTFLSIKNFSQQEARWWKCLSGLNLAIEYCEENKNSVDGPSVRATVRFGAASLVESSRQCDVR